MGAINNMTERYNVQSSTILGENYEITNIGCSDYNPSIDGNITVTITVTDVYADAISGEEVTVTCSGGTFTELNGSTITAAATVTGTTNSSGQFTLTYTCSEWGLITFSANNRSTQVNVTGFKKIAENTTYTLMVDETTRCCRIEAHRTGVTINAGQSFSGYSDFVIPTKYYPKSNCFSLIMRNATFLFWLFNNGSYGVTNLGNTVQGYNLAFTHEWHY